MAIALRVLIEGAASGPFIGLRAPISFWGGVDPETGRIHDPRHPDHGVELAGRVVWIPSTVGSSSSSSVLLELIRRRCHPAALLLGEVDPILVLGVVVAEELGWPSIPTCVVPAEAVGRFAPNALVRVEDGVVALG